MLTIKPLKFSSKAKWIRQRQFCTCTCHPWCSCSRALTDIDSLERDVQRLWVIWGHCSLRVAAGPCLPNGPITQLSPYFTQEPGIEKKKFEMLPYRPNSVFPLRGRARLTWQIVRLTAPSFSTFLVLHSAVIIRIPKDSGFQYHINWSKIIKCKLIPCLWVISSSIKELWFMIPTFWGIIPAHTIPPFAHFSFFLFSAQTISGTITSHQSAGSKGEWPSTGWTAARTPASSPSAGRPHGSASRWEEEWRLVQKFLHYRTFPP